jgi:AraC-like DNA-binding protein
MSQIHQIAISPQFSFQMLFPEGLLAEYVSMLWVSDGTPPYAQERIVPDGASVLIFNYGSNVHSESDREYKEIKKTLFTGVFSIFSNINYTANQSIHNQIGIIFKPAGVYPFLREPISEFKNLAIETDLLSNKQFDEWHERLGLVNDSKAKLLLLEKLLNEKLYQNFEETLIPQLILLIQLNPNASITEIVQKTGYSQQHLNRLLSKFGGTNAKGFQRIFKMNAVMKTIRKNQSDLNLTEIAYQSGYFDQAHFIHDFKEMVGMTPKEYRQIQQPTSSRVIYL